MSWNVEFYETEDGKIFIKDFLDSLPPKHKAKAIWEIGLLAEKGTTLREPYVKHIDGELWELRIKFSSDISRVFYFVPSAVSIVLLHGFVKKTNKTPKGEIATALKRMQDYKRRVL